MDGTQTHESHSNFMLVKGSIANLNNNKLFIRVSSFLNSYFKVSNLRIHITDSSKRVSCQNWVRGRRHRAGNSRKYELGRGIEVGMENEVGRGLRGSQCWHGAGVGNANRRLQGGSWSMPVTPCLTLLENSTRQQISYCRLIRITSSNRPVERELQLASLKW